MQAHRKDELLRKAKKVKAHSPHPSGSCAVERAHRVGRLVATLALLEHAAVADLALEEHVVLRWKTNAGAQQVLDGSALLEERVDNGGAARHEGSLQQESQDGEHGMQFLKVVAVRRLRTLVSDVEITMRTL